MQETVSSPRDSYLGCVWPKGDCPLSWGTDLSLLCPPTHEKGRVSGPDGKPEGCLLVFGQQALSRPWG